MDDHAGEDLKGRLKEAVGDVTGDKDLKRAGRDDQTSAAAKKAVDDTIEKAKEFVDPLR